MTNEEAIERINNLIRLIKSPRTVVPYCPEEMEALDLAIKALEDAEEWRKLTAVCGFDGYVIYKCRTEANDEDSN